MEKMLITKVVRTEATRADLYQKGHKWPDLKLFDLSELGAVGIDYEALPEGREFPCKFWALWELSDKLNQNDRPYKDVVALEAFDQPATATSTDTSALLAELRRQTALLESFAAVLRSFLASEPDAELMQRMATSLGVTPPPDLDAAFPRYGDGSAVSETPAERESFLAYQQANEGKPPASVAALREWYVAQGKNGG